MDLTASSVRGIDLTGAHIDGQFRDAKAELQNIAVSGPAIEGRGSGTIAFAADRPSDFQYDIAHAELSQLTSLTGQNAAGLLSTKGRLTGPWTALRLAGDASVGQRELGRRHGADGEWTVRRDDPVGRDFARGRQGDGPG